MPANRPTTNPSPNNGLHADHHGAGGMDIWDGFDPLIAATAPNSDNFYESGAEFATGVGAGAVLTQVLYLTEAGDTSAININDIHQGQIGDCFLLAAMGEMALYHPTAISNMIHYNPNGTETVALYMGLNGQPPQFASYSFKATAQTVTNAFSASSVNNGATQDVVGSQKEIWAQVVEKAYAQANGGYAGIQNGGSPFLAMEQLTGKAAQWMPGSFLSLNALTQHAAAGDLIVMDTYSAGTLPFGLVGNHAYMFEGVKSVGGTAYVQLGNPWGYAQPSLIPFAQLSRGIVEVDFGHV